MQLYARALREVRRAEQLALQVVGPAVQRADDVLGVAAAFQHDRLAVAAHVGKKLDAAGVAHQHLRVIHPGERVVIADIRDHQLVADIVRAGIEKQLLLQLEDARIEVPGDWQLAARGAQLAQAGNIGHSCCKGLKTLYFTPMSQPPQELTFEQALAELEKIVTRMESGELPLEQALATHKRGLELSRFCKQRLEAAREQVKILEGEVLKPLTDLGSSD